MTMKCVCDSGKCVFLTEDKENANYTPYYRQ